MLRQGTCDQPGCGRSGRVIAKSLPSSGRWCDQCNAKRLTNGRSQSSYKGPQNPAIVKRNKGMSRDKINGPSVKDLVKKLDAVFSVFMRQAAVVDGGDRIKCVTCDRVVPWQSMDLGHCFPRGNWAIRWNEFNVAPQCVICNRVNGGEQDKFIAFIVRVYGQKKLEELEMLRNRPHKLDPTELSKMIKQYS